MIKNASASPSQKTRLANLILYILGLLIVSRVVLGNWLPPTTEKGVWFYSALASLLLGSLLVTPFFTKPADAISYSVASIIALLAVNAGSSISLTSFDRFAWSVAIIYSTIVLISAVVSIVFKNAKTSFFQRMSSSLFTLSDTLGDPRAIFSVVFIFALIAYHRNNPREYLIIGLSWAIFVGFRPLEALEKLLHRWQGIWTKEKNIERLGEVVGHEVPNIVLIRESDGQRVSYGDILITRSGDGMTSYSLALDHVGFAEGRWLRAIHLSDCDEKGMANTSDGSVYLVSPIAGKKYIHNPIYEARDRLLGLVAPDTNVNRLYIEIIRNDLDIKQGSILETNIRSQRVLYQVIDGITKEEIIQQKNSRGFVRAAAKKIGVWDAERDIFEICPWLPQPNTPVYLVAQQDCLVERDNIGHFPGTKYPVRVELNALVTHNTAILGILGVGKSFLALELAERMIEAGIKVLCLDLTDQYAKELAKFYNEEAEQRELSEINEIGRVGKTNISQNVEEGGSICEFSAKVKVSLQLFLSSGNDKKLKILNPARFEVWRQDSKRFQDKASMATLTPCEITRIITEAALEVLREHGMTDRAQCCLIYEEAHSLIPEWNAVASEGDKTATNGTAKAILQGRKFGLGCLVITQRTANVTKSILNQCNTVFALRVFDATGMEFLSNYIGEDYARVLSVLEDRHSVIFGRASSCRDPVLVRLNDRDKFLEVFRDSRMEDLSQDVAP
ncbi:MAG: hypothetical protein A2162_11525 [Deltaproteobacteria bacterium RBG_13_52_11b]|nr:MAG: hypothetical protein A2162_11525 [Deltaproteobacteria bacterium RBG_13_52_11b]